MTAELINERRGATLWLTINRPERRNALSFAVIEGLAAGLREADASIDIRCVVITGSGDRAFCSGADLQEGGPFELGGTTPYTPYANLMRQARTSCKPIVARLNGHCLAAGVGLLAMADIAVAGPNVLIGLPEVKVGMFPLQVLSVLQSRIPTRALAEMSFTGEPLTAAEALQHNLLNYVSDPVDEKIDMLIERIERNSPNAIRNGIYAMKRTEGMTFEQSMAFNESHFRLLASSADTREGLAAFREKRQPVWAGH